MMAIRVAVVAMVVLASSIRSQAVGGTCVVSGDGLTSTCTFLGSGTFTKPAGVSTLDFTVAGAQGGTSSAGVPGSSAQLQQQIFFQHDQQAIEISLDIIVGTPGASGGGTAGRASGGSGYGNGGQGGAGVTFGGFVNSYGASGGGGSSAIVYAATPLVIAGGGGGIANNAQGSTPAVDSLTSTMTPGQTADGAAGNNANIFSSPLVVASGGGGGGYPGGGGATSTTVGSPGGSYYSLGYVFTRPLFSNTAVTAGQTRGGSVVLVFSVPAPPPPPPPPTPNPSSANGRQRARRLRRRNNCQIGFAVCNKRIATCVNLMSTFEHCGACNNDCSDLGDRAICTDGICQSY